MECPKCRKQIPDGITNCRVCGWKLAKAQAEFAEGMNSRARVGTI
jgi:ribosomal protein L37AE/L43A